MFLFFLYLQQIKNQTIMKLEIIGCKAIFIPEHDYDLFELGKIAKSIIT